MHYGIDKHLFCFLSLVRFPTSQDTHASLRLVLARRSRLDVRVLLLVASEHIGDLFLDVVHLGSRGRVVTPRSGVVGLGPGRLGAVGLDVRSRPGQVVSRYSLT